MSSYNLRLSSNHRLAWWSFDCNHVSSIYAGHLYSARVLFVKTPLSYVQSGLRCKWKWSFVDHSTPFGSMQGIPPCCQSACPKILIWLQILLWQSVAQIFLLFSQNLHFTSLPELLHHSLHFLYSPSAAFRHSWESPTSSVLAKL